MDDQSWDSELLDDVLRRVEPSADELATTLALQRARRALLGLQPPRTTIGRFEILSRLGAGGMGDVFEAHDPRLERKVALKLLRHRDPSARQRVLREARALARLSHPNVVAVYEAHAEGDELYIVMELVPGPTLRQWSKVPRHPREVARVMLAAARGLRAAHDAGLTHGDFKPENVLLGADGRVRVADFGLARASQTEQDLGFVGGSPSLGDGSTLGGTPEYMAPEVLAGSRPSPASDQFSFCTTVVEALVGRRDTDGARRIDGVPRSLTAAVRRGSLRSPAERFADLDPVIDELARFAGQPRRRRTAVAGVVLLAAGALAIAMRSPSVGRTCQAGATEFDVAWNDQRALALADTELDPGVADRIAAQLERYRSEWTGSYAEICDATHVRGEQPIQLYDRRMRCLASRRDSVDKLVSSWLESERRLDPERVSGEAARLLYPLDCLSTEPMPPARPADPGLRERVEAIDREVARASSLLGAGRVAEAEMAARHAAASAEALEFDPLSARALHALGFILREMGRSDTLETMREAMLAAARTNDHPRAARAGLEVLGQLVDARRFDEAEAIVPHVRAAIDQLEDPELLRTDFKFWLAGLATGRRDLEHAHDLLVEVIEHRKRLDDPEQVWFVVNELGTVLREQGKLAEAQAVLEEAVALAEVAVGAHHPRLAVVLHNLGGVQKDRGELERARPIIERALRLAEAGHASQTPLVTALRANLGGLELAAGNRDAAAEHYRAALRAESSLPSPSPHRIALHTNQLAKILIGNGEVDPALRHLDLAIDRLGDDDGELLARLLTTRAEGHRSLGAHVPATVDIRRALELLQASNGADHVGLHAPLLTLGALLWAQGDPRGSRDACMRGLQISAGPLGPRHRFHVYTFTCLALAELELGSSSAASWWANHAIALLDVEGVDREWGATALLVRADVEWKHGARCDALELVGRAEQLVADRPRGPVFSHLSKPWGRRGTLARCPPPDPP